MPVFSRAEPFETATTDFLDLDTSVPVEPATLRAIALHIANHFDHGAGLDGLAGSCGEIALHAEVERTLVQLSALGATPDLALLLLAGWVLAHDKGQHIAGAKRAVEPHLQGVAAALVAASAQIFNTCLVGFAFDSWNHKPSRMQRLKAAMGLS